MFKFYLAPQPYILSCLIVFSLTFLALSNALFAESVTHMDYNRVLYLMQSGQTNAALNLYHQYTETTGKHNLELVQQFALLVLEQGAYSSDPESQLLAVFGAGVSMNEKTLGILEAGMKSQQPQIQLVSLNCLATFNSDEADQIINRAVSSNSALIRYAAICYLAEKKIPSAFGQAEALMCKVDKALLPIFPEIYATIGSPEAIRTLRKLLADSNEIVRIEAIHSITTHGRDDLLPTIRILASQHSAGQQEACAFALGKFKDRLSLKKLEILACSGSPTTRLAALHALYLMGQEERKLEIIKLAKAGDLYAITLLGKISGCEEPLVALLKNINIQVRVNAALALLQHKDVRCLPYLRDLLIVDSRDLAFSKIISMGKAFTAYKVIPSAQQIFGEDDSIEMELSLSLKEKILDDALELPANAFLQLANALFQSRQNALVPKLVDCLELLHKEETIALLKKYQQQTGAPLIRNYCNLALYRLKEEGNYDQNLYTWIVQQHDVDIISFRPVLPWTKREVSTPFHLNPRETSKLLIDSFEAVAQSQDDKGVTVLLHAMQNGNAKNKYALAGLLMRTAQ